MQVALFESLHGEQGTFLSHFIFLRLHSAQDRAGRRRLRGGSGVTFTGSELRLFISSADDILAWHDGTVIPSLNTGTIQRAAI